MALGLGDHRLDQASVGLLLLAAASQLGLGLAQAEGERVADALELAGVEHPRPTDGADVPLDSLAREGRGEQLAQPLLEGGDLAAQVVARAAVSADRDATPATGQEARQSGRLKRRPRGRRGVGAKLGHRHRRLAVPGVYPCMTPAASQIASSTAISGTPATPTAHSVVRRVFG